MLVLEVCRVDGCEVKRKDRLKPTDMNRSHQDQSEPMSVLTSSSFNEVGILPEKLACSMPPLNTHLAQEEVEQLQVQGLSWANKVNYRLMARCGSVKTNGSHVTLPCGPPYPETP